MSESYAPLEAGDIYMLRGDRNGHQLPDEHFMLLERRSDSDWWILSFDTGERQWSTDVSLHNPILYERVA